MEAARTEFPYFDTLHRYPLDTLRSLRNLLSGAIPTKPTDFDSNHSTIVRTMIVLGMYSGNTDMPGLSKPRAAMPHRVRLSCARVHQSHQLFVSFAESESIVNEEVKDSIAFFAYSLWLSVKRTR